MAIRPAFTDTPRTVISHISDENANAEVIFTAGAKGSMITKLLLRTFVAGDPGIERWVIISVRSGGFSFPLMWGPIPTCLGTGLEDIQMTLPLNVIDPQYIPNLEDGRFLTLEAGAELVVTAQTSEGDPLQNSDSIQIMVVAGDF